MTAPTAAEAFLRAIESLAEAASAVRQLAFLEGQPEWLQVDELLLQVRKKVILMREARDPTKIIRPGMLS